MPHLVLDTSAYTHLRSRHPRLVAMLAEAEKLLLPVTVLGELEGGFESGFQARSNRLALSEFLAEPFVTVLPTTIEVAYQYGQVYARQRRAGRPLPANDMWIAAATIDCGGHLVTFDRDFARIEGLDCTVIDR